MPVSLNDCELPFQTTADNSSLNRRCHSKTSQNETDSATTSYSKRNGEVDIDLSGLAQNSFTLVPSGSMSFLNNGDSHDFAIDLRCSKWKTKTRNIFQNYRIFQT